MEKPIGCEGDFASNRFFCGAERLSLVYGYLVLI
jgi:hypothetical protein